MKFWPFAAMWTAVAFGGVAPAFADDHPEIVVGYVMSATGVAASLGVHYRNAVELFPTEIDGTKVRYVVRDDGSDTTAAVNIVRRLISEDHVDAIIGPSFTTPAFAVMPLVNENHIPDISTAPNSVDPKQCPWCFSIVQTGDLIMQAVADHMAAHGIKKIAYIGFSDSFGDQMLAGLKKAATPLGLTIIDEERYARADTSVQAQVLRVMASHPDAIMIGGSGTQGALPGITLHERGWKGPVYNTHGVVNPDFLRVGGVAVEGEIAPNGPVAVFDELPDSNGAKGVATAFMTRYLDKFGAQNKNSFAGLAWDADLLFTQAAKIALTKAQPGTPEFRAALRDAIENGPEVMGTHGPMKMSPTDHYGRDVRSVVMLQVQHGDWHLLP
jgi:branched-chain amino acid transport system substrate-binding protein